MAAEPLQIEVLYFDGCPNHQALLPRLHDLVSELDVDTEIRLKRIDSPQTAEHERFLGSPTVRINGTDLEPGVGQRSDYGLKCRLYPTDQGLRGDVPDHLIRAALNRANA